MLFEVVAKYLTMMVPDKVPSQKLLPSAEMIGMICMIHGPLNVLEITSTEKPVQADSELSSDPPPEKQMYFDPSTEKLIHFEPSACEANAFNQRQRCSEDRSTLWCYDLEQIWLNRLSSRWCSCNSL